MSNVLPLFNILIIIWILSSCSTRKELAPVVEHDQPPSTKVLYHTVASGETLYAIAWRYNLNYKKLASANNIGSGYNIYPGQRIRLTEAALSSEAAKTSVSQRQIKSPIPKNTHAQVAASAPSSRLKNESPKGKKSTSESLNASRLSWSWPARGPILQRFNSKNGLNKGIDIGGKLRESVFAAASGTVVYSGEGLRGYGKLVIIKHTEKYLSAYAHNHRLLVKEGDKVRRNDQIAEMGDSGTDKVMLHFEIRYGGSPVDPLAYLPSRK